MATLIRVTGDFDLAEEAVQEAFVVALERWPHEGVPDNPGAWITQVARNRAIDRIRREGVLRDKVAALERLEALHAEPEAGPGERLGEIEDDRLRLIFTCCHPALAIEARVALTLRSLGGLSTAEIARAFLSSESAMAQRIVRAKRKIAANNIPYEVPGRRADARTPAGRAGDALPGLQRGLPGRVRRGAGPHRAQRRSDPPRPRPRRDAAARARGARPAGADAAHRRAAGGAARRARRDRPARRPGPLALGRASGSPRASSSRARRRPAAPPARTRSRPGSPPSTPKRRAPAETDWDRIVRLYAWHAEIAAEPGGRAQPRGRGGDARRAARRDWS